MVKAIFILVAYEIKTRIPLHLMILTKENHKDCKMILKMVDAIEAKYGRNTIRTVVYDRGFYDYEMFGEINKQLIGFVTPSKRIGDLRRMVESTPISSFSKIKRKDTNEYVMAYDTCTTLSGYEGKVRFIIVEERYKRKKNGVEEIKKVRYGYLTNISNLPLVSGKK